MDTSSGTTTTTTMRALVQHGYGGPEVFSTASLARPAAGERQVLVRVHAAGFDRGTEHTMSGLPYVVRLALGLRTPRNPVPGREVAGTVAAVGPGVTRFAVGDEVFGTASGAFAEYTAAREDRLARKPRTLSFVQAAAVPVSGGTALRALREVGRVRAGQSVLVVGASGGVGTIAVQLAKAFGAVVTGVCSAAKADLVAGLGADHVVTYTSTGFDDDGRYHLVLDIGGSTPVRMLRARLNPRGTLVFVGGEGGGNVTGLGRQLRGAARSPFVRQRLALLIPKEHAEIDADLAELAGSGAFEPRVDRTYPLEEAPDAMRRLSAGQVRGKLVLTM